MPPSFRACLAVGCLWLLTGCVALPLARLLTSDTVASACPANGPVANQDPHNPSSARTGAGGDAGCDANPLTALLGSRTGIAAAK